MLLFLSTLLSFIFPQMAFAETLGGCAEGSTVCELGTLTQGQFGDVLSSVIQFIFVVAVILALGFLVFGGIKWLTSGGDKDAVASARGTIIAALIGLIVIFLSYFILNFVLLFLTGRGISSLSLPRIGGGVTAAYCIEQGLTPVCNNGECVCH